MSEFKLTFRQVEANTLLSGPATHILLRGGSRSSKTFTILRAIIIRALIAPESRHAVLGFRGNRITTAIVLDTFPKVLKLCFPNAGGVFDKQKGYHTFPNGSEIWFAGLDDAERAEKILGKEFVTIFLNEANQISNDTRQTATTRLAQKVMVKIEGEPERLMRTKMFYDCNPPKKSHWLYKLFIRKVDPEDNKPLKNPEEYAEMKMNPVDNLDNIDAGYLHTLDSMSAAKRRRFRDGEFGEANPNQLFDEDNFERHRVIDIDDLPDMVRIVVGVDPSGSDDKDNEKNDAIGIVAGGLGTDGNAYLLKDYTVKAGPGIWGKVACNAYEELEGDRIVGEENFGGAMVKFVIRTANPSVPYKKVHASRGKVVRAEPFSALYTDGKVRHVGQPRELEDELVCFTTGGYEGEKSPNRADAWIWVLADLFPHITRKKEDDSHYEPEPPNDPGCAY